jgi:hypothetical protein
MITVCQKSEVEKVVFTRVFHQRHLMGFLYRPAIADSRRVSKQPPSPIFQWLRTVAPHQVRNVASNAAI